MKLKGFGKTMAGIISGLIVFSGCNLNTPDNTKVILGTGPIVDKTLMLDSIENVIQLGSGNLFIRHGTTQKVTLRAQQNILNHIIYSVDNYVFSWGFDDNIVINSASDSINIEIELTRNIRTINLAGSGNVFVDGPRQKSFKIIIGGAGNFLCYGLPVNNCDIELNGQGFCQVNVSDTLSGIILGKGYIYYKGNPVIQVPVFGTGSVVADN